MNYVIFDLEWNQSTSEKDLVSDLPFEVIEIGAVKYNAQMEQIDSFQELICPQVYSHLHFVTSRLVHIGMEELKNQDPFVEVMGRFLRWCGEEEFRFCTFGPPDLTVLQNNMKYYGMAPLAQGPIPFLDLQKLYSIAFGERKTRRTLESVTELLQIPRDIPFHRAFSDAYYAGKVLAKIQTPELLRNLSYNVFHPPLNREAEIRVQFDTYTKYISREFADREAAFADQDVSSVRCYLCHRNIPRVLKWFSSGRHQYSCLARCETHGYLKGKIRLMKSENDKVFVVKTTKLISEEDAEVLMARNQHLQERRRRHRSRHGG